MKFSLKTLIWGTLVIAVSMVLAFAMFPKPLEVEFAPVVLGPLKVSVQEDGKTRIREKYIVSAPVSGRISRIELNVGDYCSEDTLLTVIFPSDPALLDARARAEANARVQAAEAALQRAQSRSEQARIEHSLSTAKYERTQDLLTPRAISQDEFDIARAEYLASAQAIKTANFEAEIASFELDMARSAVDQFAGAHDSPPFKPVEIYAPISGRILRVFEENATVVAMGAPLLELGDSQNLEIEIDVLTTDAVRIRAGAELTIDHWGGGAPLQGNVRIIEPSAFTKISSLGVEEQRVNVIADFNEPPERLASLGDGYRVEAQIAVEELNQALLIPNSALFRYQREWHVLSVLDSKAAMQRVTVGLQNNTHTQILDGLQMGDQVIVYPSDALKPGTPVRLIHLP